MNPTDFTELRGFLLQVISKSASRGTQGQTVRLREVRVALAAMAPAALPAFEADWVEAGTNTVNQDAVIGNYAQALVDMIPSS